MNRGATLLELQEVENELRDKISVYKKIQQQLNEATPVRHARHAHEDAQAAETAVRARQQDINLEWQGLRQKVDSEEQLLYSGSVSNPKELENLELEVELLKKRREKLEEQALELIEEVDLLAQTTAQTHEEYVRLEQDTRQRQGDLEDEAAVLKRSISMLRRSRERLLAEIDATDLDQYRYVQRLKNDTHAVALMEDGVCGACHIQVSNSKRDSVERSSKSKLVTCGNCGRILVT
jgi:uncharacterized protein